MRATRKAQALLLTHGIVVEIDLCEYEISRTKHERRARAVDDQRAAPNDSRYRVVLGRTAVLNVLDRGPTRLALVRGGRVGARPSWSWRRTGHDYGISIILELPRSVGGFSDEAIIVVVRLLVANSRLFHGAKLSQSRERERADRQVRGSHHPHHHEDDDEIVV